MTTALVIGDPHFSTNNVDDCKILIEKLSAVVKERKPDFVVVLGDLLHTHERIHVVPLKMATKLLKTLSKLAKTYLIIGNHDLMSNTQFLSTNHAFNSFKEWDLDLTICDVVVHSTINNHKFVFCPYVSNGRFIEALESHEEDWSTATAIFAHQEFKGCRFNPVAVSEEGDEWSPDNPLVISGHIHNEQWVGDNVYYTGSCMQHAFGESPKKGVAFVTFEAEGQEPEIETIELGMRKKKIVYIDFEKVKTFTPEENVATKIVVKGTPEQFKVFRKSTDYTRLTELGIKISFIPDSEIESNGNSNSNSEGEECRRTKKDVVDILKELVKDEPENVQKALNRILK